MRAFVTGATGFIGGALADSLHEAGWEVRLLVRPSSFSRLASPERYGIVEGDLSMPASELARCIDGCDVVFHAAAIRDRYGTTKEEYFRINVIGTRSLLQASLGRASRFVHISTVGVFGAQGVLGVDETFSFAPDQGKAGYHTSKAVAEQVVMERAGEMDVVVIRPTITYGPGDSDGMVTRLISLLAAGKFIRIGKGQNYFHLTYISDIVEGLKLAGIHPAAPGNVFILSGPSAVQVGQFIDLVEKHLGRKPSPIFIPETAARSLAGLIEMVYRFGSRINVSIFKTTPIITNGKIDTLCLQRSFSSLKAQSILGYQPRIDYPDGLKRTLKWMESARLLGMPVRSEQSPASRSKTVL
jgi:dihydroflavonol-4-reductase